jgi:hypothetical protein
MKWCDYSGETESDFIFGEETIMKRISRKENEAIKVKVVFLLGVALGLGIGLTGMLLQACSLGALSW